MKPEDGLVTIFIKRPDGTYIKYKPPVSCDYVTNNMVTLQQDEALYENVKLSVGARGHQFTQPGEYEVKAYGVMPGVGIIVSRAHRFRIAAPYSRESEELAHLLFDAKASRIMYLNGSNLHSGTMSELEEATRKYAKTNPRTVLHIHAALGSFHKNDFKAAVIKDGKWRINKNKADLDKAVSHLGKARSIPTKGHVSPLGNIEYGRISVDLTDVLEQKGEGEEGVKTLQGSITYFESQNVPESIVDNYKGKLKDLKKKK
jgi:hypothetical protein